MDRSALFLAPLRVCVGNLFAKAPGRKFTNLEKQYRSKLNTIFRYSIVTFGLAVISISVFFVHSYRSYARIVDARLARGYLTSRGGIYAAPRILRVGQKYSREDLVAVLRRAVHWHWPVASLRCKTGRRTYLTPRLAPSCASFTNLQHRPLKIRSHAMTVLKCAS